MMPTAKLRLNPHGRSFDLKFYEPNSLIYEDLKIFLAEMEQGQFLHNNYSCRVSGKSAIGYESRVTAPEELSTLIQSIKIFCKAFEINLQVTPMDSITRDSYATAKI